MYDYSRRYSLNYFFSLDFFIFLNYRISALKRTLGNLILYLIISASQNHSGAILTPPVTGNLWKHVPFFCFFFSKRLFSNIGKIGVLTITVHQISFCPFFICLTLNICTWLPSVIFPKWSLPSFFKWFSEVHTPSCSLLEALLVDSAPPTMST
jgi:hypothetical protein